MNDLVERLRAGSGGGKHWMELEAEAADEIERLTTELVRISVLNAEHIEVNETALHDRLLLSQENHKLATELGKWLKECGRLTAENEALKRAFGQPVPLSEWQQLTVERDALKQIHRDWLSKNSRGHCTNPRCKEIFATYLDEHDRLMKYEPEGGPMHLNTKETL